VALNRIDGYRIDIYRGLTVCAMIFWCSRYFFDLICILYPSNYKTEENFQLNSIFSSSQVRYNPSHFLFASCGIEKTIKLWSPLYLPGGSGQLESLTEEEMSGRKIMSRESYYQMLRRSDPLATGKNIFAQ